MYLRIKECTKGYIEITEEGEEVKKVGRKERYGNKGRNIEYRALKQLTAADPRHAEQTPQKENNQEERETDGPVADMEQFLPRNELQLIRYYIRYFI